MAAVFDKPVKHPCVWRASDPGLEKSITWHLTGDDRREILSVTQALAAHHTTYQTVARADFELPSLGPKLEDVCRDVAHGRGIAIVKGFPVDNLTVAEIELMYWGIGLYFGKAVSQSVMGDLIGHVTDVSGKDPNERAYRNSLELPLHTDLSDMIAMLSIRASKEGGLSLYSSVAAVHNEMLACNPELLPSLYHGYRMHRFGEQAPGEPPVTAHRVPVLSEREGYVSARIVPEYIDMAEVELGEPMAPIDRQAVDTFLATAMRDDICLRTMLEPGDLSVINNYAVLHARTLFNDFVEPERKRLLLRLWLDGYDRRPVHEDAFDVSCGGIAQQKDRDSSYFDGDTARRANRGRYGEAAN